MAVGALRARIPPRFREGGRDSSAAEEAQADLAIGIGYVWMFGSALVLGGYGFANALDAPGVRRLDLEQELACFTICLGRLVVGLGSRVDLLRLIQPFLSKRKYISIQFLFTAMQSDALAPKFGTHSLEDFFRELVGEK